MICSNCQAYVEEKRHCHRYPLVVEKIPTDWCLEFKEVIICPVVEKEKVSEVKVVEKVESEPVKKRGWPKGVPRK